MLQNFKMWIYNLFETDDDMIDRLYRNFKEAKSFNQNVRVEYKNELAEFIFHRISSFGLQSIQS